MLELLTLSHCAEAGADSADRIPRKAVAVTLKWTQVVFFISLLLAKMPHPVAHSSRDEQG
jgi:hypothetical protein